MAILTNSGRVAMAMSVKAQDLHLAWGSGDAAWDTTPVPESITAEALLAEIGRRKATYVNYTKAGDHESLTKFLASWSGHARWADASNLITWLNKEYITP